MSIDCQQSKVIYRKFHGSMDVVTGGAGHYLFFDDGKKRLDLSSGPCTSSLGHSNVPVIAAIKSQLDKIPFAFSGFWATEQSEKLGELIYGEFERTWPGWFGKVLFLCAGGEAVDLTCKLVSQYWAEGGEQRHVVGAREFGFHGVGTLTAALSGDYPRYEIMAHYHRSIRNNYVIRLPGYVGWEWTGKSLIHNKYETDLLLETDKEIGDGEGSLAAVIVETVGGPPVGAAAPSRYYLEGLRKICDQHDTLLVFDEILCGVGRCGAFTAAQLYGIKPDILLLGKGLTAGYIPLSAICISKRVVNRLVGGSGMVSFGTTYSAHTTACAAGAATLKYLRNHDLYNVVFERRPYLKSKLEDYLENLPMVFAIRGRGYLWGIEFCDPERKTPFKPEVEFHLRVRKEAYKYGLVTYSKGQTVDGWNDYLIVAPPFEMSQDTLVEAWSTLRKAIVSAYDQYRSEVS